MTPEGIKQVQGTVDKLGASANKVLSNVSPSDVVTARDDPLPFIVQFNLGDRVVYALDNTPVPFGLRGTVVASKGKTLDVLFDSDFVGGKYPYAISFKGYFWSCSTLEGTCSDFRGKTVPANAVYNISR